MRVEDAAVYTLTDREVVAETRHPAAHPTAPGAAIGAGDHADRQGQARGGPSAAASTRDQWVNSDTVLRGGVLAR
jgi:hypothetical protein